MNAVLVFCAVVLSFLQFGVEGAGSFIALDIASVLYFIVHPRRLFQDRAIWACLMAAACALACTKIIIGANEFQFVFRLALVFIDAFFLKEMFQVRQSPAPAPELVTCRALLLAASAYAFAFLLWWTFVPEGNEAIFYLNNTKQWIATFPALFAASQLVARRNRPALFCAFVAICLSFYDSSASRALLLQSALIFLIALWRENRRLAKFAICCAGVVALLSLTALDAFVEKHDHSNTFRLVMMLQILDFSTIELLLGRGIDLWRLAAFEVLFEMPGAETFFEAANPHFFPAELIIRGGVALFACVFLAFYIPFRASSSKMVALVMLLATFFTTNTGVERLYMSLAIFILISTRLPQRDQSAPARELSVIGSRHLDQQLAHGADAG